jgi:predicted ABC-type transport system involved in lysophospholipase L1 biosynthesis ATPase subunit
MIDVISGLQSAEDVALAGESVSVINPSTIYSGKKSNILAEYIGITKPLFALYSSLPEAKLLGLRDQELIAAAHIKFKEIALKELLKFTLLDSLALLKNIPACEKILSPLCTVSLGHLTLDRLTVSLSSGEWRRVYTVREMLSLPKRINCVVLSHPAKNLSVETARKFLQLLLKLGARKIIILENNPRIIELISCLNNEDGS